MHSFQGILCIFIGKLVLINELFCSWFPIIFRTQIQGHLKDISLPQKLQISPMLEIEYTVMKSKDYFTHSVFSSNFSNFQVCSHQIYNIVTAFKNNELLYNALNFVFTKVQTQIYDLLVQYILCLVCWLNASKRTWNINNLINTSERNTLHSFKY